GSERLFTNLRRPPRRLKRVEIGSRATGQDTSEGFKISLQMDRDVTGLRYAGDERLAQTSHGRVNLLLTLSDAARGSKSKDDKRNDPRLGGTAGQSATGA